MKAIKYIMLVVPIIIKMIKNNRYNYKCYTLEEDIERNFF